MPSASSDVGQVFDTEMKMGIRVVVRGRPGLSEARSVPGALAGPAWTYWPNWACQRHGGSVVAR